jgi:ComF family protein
MSPLRFSVGHVLRKVGDALASLAFPAPCRVCEATLDTASRIPICRACLDSLRPLTGAGCHKCGRPFVSALAALVREPLCQLCRKGVYGFDLVRSYGAYNDAMVRAMVLLKYHAVTPLGDWFAARLVEVVAREPESLAADVVVPVPLHPARLRERGYNQAELIAHPLARRLNLSCRSELMVRVKPRPAKQKLTRHERWESVRGAYAIRERARVDNLRVLLVDDVLTTGATLDSCARVLRKAGAARVVGLTVARALSDWAVPSWTREQQAVELAGELST